MKAPGSGSTPGSEVRQRIVDALRRDAGQGHRGAETRTAAARKLASVLSRARIHGSVTNRDLLVSILRDPTFQAGEVSTDFLTGFRTDRLDR